MYSISKKNLKSDREPGFIFITLMMSLAYTILRFELNVEYENATWSQLYELKAPIPFGNRILIPVLSRPFVEMGFTIKQAYFFWELCSVTMLILVLYRLFFMYVEEKWAQVLALGFVFILPLAFLLQFKWPLFYPYDTPAILMVCAGMLLLLKQKWFILSFLLFLATLNRESSILILLMFFVLYVEKLSYRRYVAIGIALCCIYAGTRYGVGILTEGNPRPYHGSLALVYRHDWRFINNIVWVTDLKNAPILLATLGFIPLFLVSLRQYIPQHLARLNFVTLVYFCMLFFIGNLYEPRIFGEILIISYFLFGLSLFLHLTDKELGTPYEATVAQRRTALSPFVEFVDRFGLILIVFATLLGVLILLNVDVGKY